MVELNLEFECLTTSLTLHGVDRVALHVLSLHPFDYLINEAILMYELRQLNALAGDNKLVLLSFLFLANTTQL